MKKHSIQIIAMLFLAVSCQKGTAQPEPHSAARQIYKQYANVEGLTVALVENYATKGDTINAVMIQAQNPDAWQRLLSDFDFGLQQIPAPDPATKASYLSISRIHADTLRGDTIRDDINEFLNTKIQEIVTEELLNEKLQEFMPDMSKRDSLLLNALKSMPMNFDTSIVHSDTSIAVTNSQTWVNGHKVSDITTTDSTAHIHHNRRLMEATLNGQENGYIVHAESDEMTLWLFFYSSPEQHDAILDRINNN